MNWLNILGLAVGLAMDAFAVSVAAGLTVPQVTRRHVFRVAWHFGLFQFLMPVLGWLAGVAVAEHIHAYDHWAAAGLLGILGGKMLYEAWRGDRAGPDADARAPRDPTRGITLVLLSIATSIDALAVGVTLAFLDVSIWLPSVVIGLVAGALSAVGITFGGRIGPRRRRWAEAAGGIVLLAIGARILIADLAGG